MQRLRKSLAGNAGLNFVLWSAGIIGLVYGLYRFFGAWSGMTATGRFWWRSHLADPIVRLMTVTLTRTGDDPITAIAMIAFAYWLFIRVWSWLFELVGRSLFINPQAATDSLVIRMESAQGRLKKLFADDIEKIALYGGAFEENRKSSRDPVTAGCTGCGVMAAISAVSIPFATLVGLAALRGLERLFGHPATQSITILGRSLVLAERSLLLTVAAGILGYFSWLATGISKSGWRLPRLRIGHVLTYLCMLTLTYFFLDVTLLLFGIFLIAYSMAARLLLVFIVGPLRVDLVYRCRLLLAQRSRANVAGRPT